MSWAAGCGGHQRPPSRDLTLHAKRGVPGSEADGTGSDLLFEGPSHVTPDNSQHADQRGLTPRTSTQGPFTPGSKPGKTSSAITGQMPTLGCGAGGPGASEDCLSAASFEKVHLTSRE